MRNGTNFYDVAFSSGSTAANVAIESSIVRQLLKDQCVVLTNNEGGNTILQFITGDYALQYEIISNATLGGRTTKRKR